MKAILKGLFIILCYSAMGQEKGETIVYMCKGTGYYTYHTGISCEKLRGCQYGRHISMDSAVNVYNRWPCCVCTKAENCKTDNKATSGSSSDSGCDGWDGGGCDNLGSGCNDPYVGAVVAAVAVAGLVVMVSNDIYIGATYSTYSDLKKPVFNGVTVTSQEVSPGFGVDVHFRKNFEVCRLEYGGGYIEHDVKYKGYYDNGNLFSTHQIRQLGTIYAGIPFYINGKYSEKDFLFFAGPVFRWNLEPSGGGMIGMHYRLGEHFKFDARYELTNTSGQIQVGFALTYQKDYFWR